MRAPLATAIVATGLAPAAASPAGESLVAFGAGPAATIDGALGERLRPDGAALRVRLGGRIGGLGLEVAMAGASATTDHGARASLVVGGPVIAWYPLATRWVAAAVRGGISTGVVSETVAPATSGGDPTMAPPLDHRVLVLDLGATAHVTLGPRAGSRLLLWVDVGWQRARVAWEGAVVTGDVRTLVLGVGHDLAF